MLLPPFGIDFFDNDSGKIFCQGLFLHKVPIFVTLCYRCALVTI